MKMESLGEKFIATNSYVQKKISSKPALHLKEFEK